MQAKILKWAAQYSKLIAVLSAVVLLASWLVEKFIVEKLHETQEQLVALKSAKINAQRQFHVESKLLEVYQISNSASSYALLALGKDKINKQDEVVRIADRLTRIDVTKEFLTSFLMYIGVNNSDIAKIDPPDAIREKVKNNYNKVQQLQNRFSELESAYKTSQKNIIGSSDNINPNTITADQIQSLDRAVEDFRKQVDNEVAARMPDALNDSFRTFDELFSFAESKIKRFETYNSLAKITQLILFVIGSILAIYGSYAEAVYGKK